ncbi:MAG TPA: ATP-binding cassette domain-containing protein [Candidatus Onthomonas avicola]|nr:ATP-binding cassette domain-containing protein [Candidatus Onthomonas avicola]
MSLEARNLSFRYRRRGGEVLRDISLTLAPGERLGLGGASGRGKTTLCKLLAGYERPTAGQVLADGVPPARWRGFAPVQMIWQHPESAVDPLLKLRETLYEAGPVPRRLLDALGIQPGWLDRYPSELSGGELQRFCLARALRPQVRYLLCDELSAMLDPITQAQLWAFLLDEARERGLGLLIVSHERALLDRLCTRRISLDE